MYVVPMFLSLYICIFNVFCFIDDTRDKDNEISDFGSVKAAFEVPCPSDVSLLASNAENNYRGKKKKRRSSSCPHEGVDKNMHSKAVFFSPAAKLVKSPASCQPKRGTLITTAIMF